MVFCAQCGTSGEGRFCTECGARLTGLGGPTNASTSQVEPPPYNPYAEEPTGGSTPGGSTPADRAAQIGGVAFSTRTSMPTASGTSQGPTQPVPRSNIRGVSGSSIPSATTLGGTSAPASAAHTVAAGFVNQPVANALYQQQESPTALFGSQGYRLDPFFHIAREIFVALDRSTHPAGSGMMEASKMRRFRELSGKAIPPYYETHVLPMYCAYYRLFYVTLPPNT
jgi:hypothetical protein